MIDVFGVARERADHNTVADAQESDTDAADYLLSGDGQPNIQVIKSGSIVKGDGTVGQTQQ